MQRQGVLALGLQLRRHARLVVHLHQKVTPPLLDEAWFGGTGGDLHARLGIDRDLHQHVRVEQFLQFGRILFLDGGVDGLALIGR